MEADKWWSTWAPVWDHMEDRYFGTKTTEALLDKIKSGALIIGAGQGLIARFLKDKGIKAVGLDINPDMVRIAKEKHGIKIIKGDARDLPFKNNSYNTVIISSGVVDYCDDQSLITTFFTEARRVCRNGGKILAAFYRIPEPIEKIYRRIGVIDADGVYHMDRIFEINEIANIFPPKCAKPIQEWTGKSMARVNLEWLAIGLTRPKEFMTEQKWINNVFESGKNIGLSKYTLLASIPTSLPYRTKSQIKDLLAQIHVDYIEIKEFDDCSVVVIEK